MGINGRFLGGHELDRFVDSKGDSSLPSHGMSSVEGTASRSAYPVVGSYTMRLELKLVPRVLLHR